MRMVRYSDVEAAVARQNGRVNRTPVLTSRQLDSRTGAGVFLKCENFQRTGSFKFRGALNALLCLPEKQRRLGVLSYSSGNHAQALALAGKLLDVAVTIVMPCDAPAVKRAATEDYGGSILLYDREETTREAYAAEIAKQTGAAIIPPYDHPDVIAGQGTSASELFDEVGDLDMLLVCCGGGGLLSGSAVAASERAPGCHVIGVEPDAADDACRSFKTGTLHHVDNPDTIADGARTPSLGRHTFPIVRRLVHEMISVPDESLVRTMYFFWERLKLVAEPTGVLAAAGLLDGGLEVKDRKIGVIVSGGNVDIRQACRLFSAHLGSRK